MAKQIAGADRSSRQLKSFQVKSVDENENNLGSIDKSDFTFLFNPQGKDISHDQVQPWSKKNSVSKSSVGDLIYEAQNNLSVPQILALKQIQKGKSNEMEEHKKSIDTLIPSSMRIDSKEATNQKLIMNTIEALKI